MVDRRPIPARSNALSLRAAKTLASAGVSPNQVSLASVLFAVGGGVSLVASRDVSDPIRCTLLVIAALCIPARLLCNMLDGMIAVEFGKQSKSGDIYNELPDRVADVLFLAAAGYAVSDFRWLEPIGWIAATLAVLTAYVRTLGAARGLRQDYSGPMAKQQRMAVLSAACLASAVESLFGATGFTLAAGLIVIALGSLFTLARRTGRLLTSLEAS